MKRILMVAPASYPVIGAEAIVNIKLLYALTKDKEFVIDLISKKVKWQNYPSESLEEMGFVVNSINIIEVDNKVNLFTIWGHVLSFLKFGIVFKGSHWAVEAVKIAKRLVKVHKYDYVLTKSGPSELVGYYLKKKTGIKWIATWNDPYPVNKYPRPYGYGLYGKETFADRQMIGIMKKYVDIHLFPNKRLGSYMNTYLKQPLEKIKIAPHVVLSNMQIQCKANNTKLLMLHAGNLNYPRNPENFFKALQLFVNNININIEFHILGVVSNDTIKLIENLKLKDYIKIIPPIPYSDSLKILENYHIALIIEAPCDEGIFLPTKVSDYMQSDISVFSISPNTGVLNDLYASGYIPYCADIRSVDCIYSELKKIYSDFSFNSLCKIKVDPTYTEESIRNLYLNL